MTQTGCRWARAFVGRCVGEEEWEGVRECAFTCVRMCGQEGVKAVVCRGMGTPWRLLRCRARKCTCATSFFRAALPLSRAQ